MPIMVPPAAPSGVLRYQWIDPTGTTRELSREYSPNLFIERGSVGLNYNTFNVSDSKLPLSAGTLINKINTEARRFTLPVFIRADTMEVFLQNTTELAKWFDTGNEEELRPGYFRVTRPDDTVRQIAAYYVSGLEGDTGEGAPNWAQYGIELYSPDPIPTGTANEETTKDETNFASFGIMNIGDLDAYPIIELTGPITNFNVNNTTKGQNISGQIVMTSGQTLTIDTRPSELRTKPSVYDQSDVNRLSVINPISVWWTLQTGLNVISFSTDNSDSNSRVKITYLPRYRTLLR